jgi:hypothetical protein
LPQIGGALAGISALAYVAGRNEAQSYFYELGAPWAFSMMPVSRLVQDSVWLMTTVSLMAFLSLLGLLEKRSTAKTLKRWSLIWAGAAIIAYLPNIVPDGWISPRVAQPLALMTGFFWALSAGLTVGELIATLKDSSLKWGPYHLWLIYFIFLFGLIQAPRAQGSARAAIDSDPKNSALPVIAPVGSSDESWRLITLIDGKLLLGRLSPNPKDRAFRLLNIGEAWEIRARK